MSWKETYNAWKNYQALEPDLKDELAKLEGNDEALEDAFMLRWNSERRGCAA